MAVTPPSRKPQSLWLVAALLATGLPAHAQQPTQRNAEEVLWTCSSVGENGEWVCDFDNAPDDGKAEQQGAAAESVEANAQPQPPAASSDSLEPATLPTFTPRVLAEPDGRFRPADITAETMDPLQPQEELEPPANAYQDDMVSRLGQDADSTGYLRAYPWMFARAPQFQSSRKWDCQAEEADWVCRERVDNARAASLVDPQTYQQAYLDWYPNPAGVDAKTHCDGSYVEPLFRQPEDFDPNVEPPLFVEADRAQSRIGELTQLDGVVRLMKGQRHLHSQYAELDQTRNRATLRDQVMFREPGLLMLGERAEVDTQTGDTRVHEAQFVMHGTHLRGEAEQVDRSSEDNLLIKQGSFTRCEPGNNSWMVQGSEIELRPETGFGAAWHATLRVAGVPVLYVPYIHFPIDDRRKSGFLVPSVGLTSDNGLDVATPYYFNIAPNLDDTLTPRVISERGVMLENEFRYLNRRGNYKLSTGYLPDDDVAGRDRWLLGLDHRGSLIPGWNSVVDFNAVSDDDYFDDLETAELSISKETHLERFAQLSRQDRYWNLTARLHDYQTIDATASAPYAKLPELLFRGYLPTGNSYTVDYRAQYSYFDRDPDEFSGIDRITGQRAHLETTLARPFEWPWAYVRPKLRLMHTQYSLEEELPGNSSNVGRSLPLVSLDNGLIFERAAAQGRTQTLEPRLFYLYVPKEDQSDLPLFDSSDLTFSYGQLFRDNRFSGLDRIGDTHQASASLSTRMLDSAGRETMRLSLGQIFYFEDREVTLRDTGSIDTRENSDLAAELFWQANRYLRLTADGLWDHSSFQNRKRNFKLVYRSDLDHVLSLGYRYTRDELEQTDASMIWPINNQWSLLGRWLRDIQEHENLEEVIGLEYESCCWKTRLVRRAWIDDDQEDRDNEGFFLEVTLKGLGTTGQGGEFLDEITGFKTRDDYEN